MIEPVEAGDRAAVAAALTAAFMDDPVTNWAAPSDRHRPAVLRHFFGCFVDIHVGAGTVYADGDCQGAAIWALPGRWRTTAGQDLRIARAFAHPRHWRPALSLPSYASAPRAIRSARPAASRSTLANAMSGSTSTATAAMPLAPPADFTSAVSSPPDTNPAPPGSLPGVHLR